MIARLQLKMFTASGTMAMVHLSSISMIATPAMSSILPAPYQVFSLHISILLLAPHHVLIGQKTRETLVLIFIVS